MKLGRKLVCLSAAALFCTSALAANLEPMTKEQVQQAFVNKTSTSIPVVKLNGKVVPNTFMGYMDDKGNIYGKMLNKPAGEPQTDTGVYTIEDDGTMDITWNHWNGKEKRYVSFYETQNAYLVVGRDSGFDTAFLKATIVPDNKLGFPAK